MFCREDDLTGYSYFLESPISTSQRVDEDRMTYLNKGRKSDCRHIVSSQCVSEINTETVLETTETRRGIVGFSTRHLCCVIDKNKVLSILSGVLSVVSGGVVLCV